MPIYRLGHQIPDIHPDAYVHPDAVVIGNVRLGPESSVWPGAVLRGDTAGIVVGARTSVQDGSVIHVARGRPTTIGDGCVVGHMVHLEGCTVEDDVLIGSGAVVLHLAIIGTGATVGANAVVTNKMVIPPGVVAVGVPAVVRQASSDLDHIRASAERYVANGRRYRHELKRLD